jgi:cytochrome c oxidase subunit 2
MVTFVVQSLLPPTVGNFMSEFYLFLVLGGAAGVFTIGWLVYNVVRFRSRGEELGEIQDNGRDDTRRGWLTAAVTIGILAVALITALEGTGFIYSAPQIGQTMTIKVYAFQWGWNFTYPDGYSDIGTLIVPANTTIILNVTSKDVFHSLGIPQFYVKADAIPGQWNSLWFVATNTGNYSIACYELCGVGHAFMKASLLVETSSQFEQWYAGTASGSTASATAQLVSVIEK